METRAQLLSERVADLCQQRRRDRVARSACQTWFAHARRRGQGRENLRLASLWERRQSLKSALARCVGGERRKREILWVVVVLLLLLRWACVCLAFFGGKGDGENEAQKSSVVEGRKDDAVLAARCPSKYIACCNATPPRPAPHNTLSRTPSLPPHAKTLPCVLNRMCIRWRRLMAATAPPTAGAAPPLRDLAEAGRGVQVSIPSGWTGNAVNGAVGPAGATVGSEAGRLLAPAGDTGVWGQASGGGELWGDRGDGYGVGTVPAAAVPAAVTHSPIRVDAFTSTDAGQRPSLLSSGAAAATDASVLFPQAAAASSPHEEHHPDSGATLDENSGDGGAAEEQERLLRLELLAGAAAGEFRRKRDRLCALRVLAAWRCAVARERSKRGSLSRIVRNHRKRRMTGGFSLWREGARAARAKEDSRRARGQAAAAAAKEAAAKEEAAAAKAAKAVAAAGAAAKAGKAAAEKMALEREEELRREKAAGEELRRAVEHLRAEVGVAVFVCTAGRLGVDRDHNLPSRRVFSQCCLFKTPPATGVAGRSSCERRLESLPGVMLAEVAALRLSKLPPCLFPKILSSWYHGRVESGYTMERQPLRCVLLAYTKSGYMEPMESVLWMSRAAAFSSLAKASC